MNLKQCVQQALIDAHELVEKGYWIRIETYSVSVLLHYGIIHSDGELECSLRTKLYIADKQ